MLRSEKRKHELNRDSNLLKTLIKSRKYKHFCTVPRKKTYNVDHDRRIQPRCYPTSENSDLTTLSSSFLRILTVNHRQWRVAVLTTDLASPHDVVTHLGGSQLLYFISDHFLEVLEEEECEGYSWREWSNWWESWKWRWL